ncbi:MAG: choice-of-anchor D domain-containing protein, partial [Calditrichaeota bacterium]|nr:choice-of-anchor D domain-containing protein [Calditrichota bacterium]
MVRVNSENLLGGVYEGSIQINSNDPVSPAVKMPVTLTVNGLAVISTSPDSLQFSELLAGETETLQVEVANIGNGPLTVSNIASTNAAFSPTPTSLVIAPFSAEMVDVVFAPTAAGSFDGYLELTSDDPSTPVDTVVLSGSAIDAPIASISPDSFDVTLAIGSTATDTLVISNDGSTPLEFNVSVEFASAANMKVEVLGQPKNDNQMVIASGKPLPLVALNQTQFAVAMNASGEPDFEAPSFAAGAGNENDPAPSIAGEEVFGSNASSFGPSGLRGRGNLFTVTSSTTLSEHRLYLNPTAATKMHFVVAESDAQVGTYTTISVAELTAAGPGEGWYSSGAVNVPLQAGKFYLIFAQWEGNANYYNEQNIAPYPIQASFGELTAAAGWSTGSVPTYADPPATEHPIAATAFGAAVAYYQTLVTGSGSWLTPSITDGTVPANSSVEVLLTFDPAGLVGGDYEADVVVTSNDPANPELRAYAHMFVVGQALVSADPVVFANPVFVGGMDSTTMVVRNEGNGVLNVTDVASDNAVFSVSQTAFDVAAFDSAEVTVYFMPTAEGGATGTLTISSNDPANPTLAVAVSATAVIAPSFSIDPDSLGANLGFSDSTDAPMLIENTGGSPLSWAVSVILGKSKTVFPEMRGNASNAGEVDAASSQTPGLAELNTPQRVMDDVWDLQFSHDIEAVSGGPGNAGVEFDGQYYYTTRWASNLIHKYEVDGGGNLVLVEEFSITGVTGLRDLAYDGQYFYGGAAAGTIYQMDFDSKTLVGTIASPQPVRHIAYDSDLDAFYVGNWSTDIVLVDRSGAVLNTLPAASHTGTGLYGSAYDNTSDGGPYLWIFDQNGTSTTPPVQTPNLIKQIALPSGVATGVEYDVVPDLGNGVDILLAGGLFISTDIVPGKVTIGGVSQSVPDGLFGYELGDAASGSSFMRITDFTSGVINPGDVGGFTVRL